MFKEILGVLVLIHMTMSYCRPLPNGGYTCTTYCDYGKGTCVGRKKREAMNMNCVPIPNGGMTCCSNGECVGRKKREAKPAPQGPVPGCPIM